jgi:hypothetical protein
VVKNLYELFLDSLCLIQMRSSIHHAPAFMEQLLALGIKLGDYDSAARSLATLKTELAEEKVMREKAQVENDTLACAVDDLKKLVD